MHFKMADEVKSRSLEEISAFISQSVCEMEKLLHKLDWSKDKLLEAVNSEKMVQCPLNRAHRVPLLRLGKHVNDCKFKSLGLKPQDSCNGSEFFYQTSKAVISVFVENSAALGQGNDQVQGKESKDEAYCFDEMRSIMSWDVVPASHTKLQLEVLPQQKIRDWIIKNVPQVQYLSSVEGSCDRLVNFVLSCLQEDKVAHPDGMEKMLKDLLGNETRTFVLNLWKFLAVSIAQENHQARIDKANEQVDVPMERAVSELTPQQRLAVYEHVVEVSKARREVKSEDIDAEVGTKSTDTTADGQDQPKSRYELLAEQRDYKRRRQSYRAKNVHITKRSAVEVMRDLIETQMNVLEMQLKNERGGSAYNSDEEDAVSFEGRRSRGSRGEDEESTTVRRDSRDEGRKKQREGHKRVSYYDETDIEKKKWRR